MNTQKIRVTWTAKYESIIEVAHGVRLNDADVMDEACDIDPCAACGMGKYDTKYIGESFEVLKLEKVDE